MSRHQPLTTDYEDNLDVSTAPTTPDVSLNISPVLQEQKLQEALEHAATEIQEARNDRMSSDTTLCPKAGVVKRICCVGAGYVGGPTAAVMAFHNPTINVTVVDKDESRIKRWNSRHLPIYEPGLSEIVRIGRDGTRACTFFKEATKPKSIGSLTSASSAFPESQCDEYREEVIVPARAPNLFFSTEISQTISEADIVLIAVNTPTKTRGLGAGRAIDVAALEAVTKEIAIHANPNTILVSRSTVPSRTADIIYDTLKIYRPGVHFEVLSNPEFLAAGTAVNDLLNADRIIIGCSSTPSGRHAAETLASVYASWIPRSRIININIWSSELSKLVANAMLAQRISSINSISTICEKTGANVDEVSLSIGLDSRIGNKYLKAGLGFGGSCFKKDILSLLYVAECLGLDEVAEYWQQVIMMNESQRMRFTRRIIKSFNGTLVEKKITILGYAFKKDTNDTRESPALEMIKELSEDGPAQIAIFDPCCEPDAIRTEIKRLLKTQVEDGVKVEVYGDVYEACKGSHAVIIATDCDEFRISSLPSSESEGSLTTKSKIIAVDPRPFTDLEPTESKILAMQRYLSQVTSSKIEMQNSGDSLGRYLPEPACEPHCSVCVEEKRRRDAGGDMRDRRVDWKKIASGLVGPKWVFDGRGVLAADGEVMRELGVRVVGIGRGIGR